MTNLILFNKPYGVNSQFSGTPKNETLSAFINLPGFYPAGRLDKKSEGLLLLTDNGKLQHHLTQPGKKKFKYYWVLVEGCPEERDLIPIREGLSLQDFKCLPAKVRLIAAPDVWPRTPPVRFRKLIKDTWLEIAIEEGKNHQIRRMTSAIGFPTLRLIRHRIDQFSLNDLQPGQWRKITVRI